MLPGWGGRMSSTLPWVGGLPRWTRQPFRPRWLHLSLHKDCPGKEKKHKNIFFCFCIYPFCEIKLIILEKIAKVINYQKLSRFAYEKSHYIFFKAKYH